MQMPTDNTIWDNHPILGLIVWIAGMSILYAIVAAML